MFNFYRAMFPNPRAGKKLHIIKTLIDMRERSGVTNDDRAALLHAICYIKNLEEEVSAQNSVSETVNVGALSRTVTVKNVDSTTLDGIMAFFRIGSKEAA